MSTTSMSPAVRATRALVEVLAENGITATHDAGAFFPQPVGVLVGLPTMIGRGLSTRTFTVPVLVVSGDPLNRANAADRLYTLADEVAWALATDNYRPSSWQSGVNSEPLPAIELTVTITETETEE